MKPFALALFLLAAAPLAHAQEPVLEPLPDAPSAASPEPEVTIRHRNGDRIEEYRINGALYMIKVYPTVGAPYYLVRRDRDGAFQRFSDLDRTTPPQWVVVSW